MSAFDMSQVSRYKPFFGKDGGVRLFTGTVVDNEDPDKMCRIKVTFPHLLEGGKEDLPWMYPLFPATLGQSTKLSHFAVPENGSTVMCIFPEGSIYFGYYAWHTRDKESIPEIFKTNYPKRYGFIDNKNYLMIDKKVDSLTVQWADVNIHIQDGTITVKATNNINLIAGKSITMKAKDDITMEAKNFKGKFSKVAWSQ